MRTALTKSECAQEQEVLLSVYIPEMIQGIRRAKEMADLVHRLTSLALLARVNRCLMETTLRQLTTIVRPYSEALPRVVSQTAHSHFALEFLGYLSGAHREHDELTLEARFLMSDGARLRTRAVLKTEGYRVQTLEMNRLHRPKQRVEYVYNDSRSRYEFVRDNVAMYDGAAPTAVLPRSPRASLLARLLRAHHVVTQHWFPLVEHVYSRRLAENPATIRNMEIRGAVLRVDNLVSTESLSPRDADNGLVFFR